MQYCTVTAELLNLMSEKVLYVTFFLKVYNFRISVLSATSVVPVQYIYSRNYMYSRGERG